MSTNYSLSFFLKKPKNYKSGPKPIYLRITVDCQQKDISVGRQCEPSRWDSHANRVNGSKEDARSINSYLDTVAHKVAEIHHTFVRNETTVTAEIMKLKFLGRDIERKKLLEVFAEHNAQVKALLGRGFKPNTLKGYNTSISHLRSYLEQGLKRKDIEVNNIDHSFVVGYEFFLRADLGCSEVSAAKYIKHFRKVIRICIAHRWIKDDPFTFYKNKAKATPKEFLTKDELRRIEEKEFTEQRLAHVRDVFVFCCYTGLSYADVKKLTPQEIGEGVDGKLWILTSREKTETTSNIPLLKKAMELITLYRDYPPCSSKNVVLPVPSNQKANAYLKEIAQSCGVHKALTFHMSRHTFATTVTLANNVPIETVSKMLGHTDIKTTQHYAKLLDSRVAQDMSKLERKLRRG
ncbi:site-specific integrase [Sphingobacterium deserti]|uniref:Integrase family protein n=1 Tax=Sphingobacterium deserti TaxID=1229276 RepID=A0A0B8T9P5_9SPHI|nr:site-specific integrase [Sphingobacterium deserti]KGE14735.1 integrase family protein [Sphingobacterium deserti]